MKTLLYVSANSKTEEKSSSKTVARALVNALLEQDNTINLQEVDLYKDHIPKIKGCYFEGRSALLSQEKRSGLTEEEQKEVENVEALCDQFVQADIVILASPMWSLSFPAPVKEYFDCVVQVGKSMEFKGQMPHGLLDDKERHFVYVQSSGGEIPLVLRPTLNRGLNYIKDLVKFLGMSDFYELLVDGTGKTEAERQEAMQKAEEKIPKLCEKILS